jgi:hypothetical protein
VLEDIVRLPDGKPLVFELPVEDEDNTNCALVEFYQGEVWTEESERLKFRVMCKILEEPTFDVLRTKE